MSIVTYNNRSIANISAVPGAAKSLTHIKTVTASGQSDVTFVNGTSDVVLDSTYPIYIFKLINVHGAANDEKFYVNFRDGGSSYDANKTATNIRAFHFESDSANGFAYQDSLDIANSTGNHIIGQEIGTANDSSGCGELILFNPSSTTFVKHFITHFHHHYQDGAPGIVDNWTGGYCNTTTAIDGVQFKFNAANIDSGTFKLYGLKDS